MDNFKGINDNFGHGGGDRVLSEVSASLREFVGGDGVVGRYGGDELLLVLEGITDYDEVHAFFSRMYQSGRVFRRGIPLDERSVYITIRKMTEGFDSADDLNRRLWLAFEPMRDNLHLDRLLYLTDGVLWDMERGEALMQPLLLQGKVPDNLYVLPDTQNLLTDHRPLLEELDKMGVESALVACVTDADREYGRLIFCPEPHTKHIWQDDEYAAAFILSRILSQFLKSQDTVHKFREGAEMA